MTITINGTTGIAGVDGSASTPAVQGTDTNTGIFFPAADTIAFGEGGAEAMRITSAGDVGIGTTSPNIGGVNKALTLNSAASTNCSYELSVNGTHIGSMYTNIADSSIRFGGWQNAPMVFLTNSAERARITSGGDLLVGSTSIQGTSGSSINFGAGNGACSSVVNNNLANNGTLDISFNTGGGGWMGILMVSNMNVSNGNSATRTVYAVLGRGTTCTFTSLATQNGSTSGFSFSMSCPSNGVMRLTNTGGSASAANMTFFGGLGS